MKARTAYPVAKPPKKIDNKTSDSMAILRAIIGKDVLRTNLFPGDLSNERKSRNDSRSGLAGRNLAPSQPGSWLLSVMRTPVALPP